MRKLCLLLFLWLTAFWSYSDSLSGKNRQQIVRELFDSVEEWMGTPYVYGGNSKSGIDCSAFVSRVYRKVFDIELPRTVAFQKSLGVPVTGKLQPGDLLFFNFGHGISHVGIFVFGEKFIHAASGGPSVGVVKCSLKERYYKQHYVYARRLVTLPVTESAPKIAAVTSNILMQKENARVQVENTEVTPVVKKMLATFWKDCVADGVKNLSISVENQEDVPNSYVIEVSRLSSGQTKKLHLFDVSPGLAYQQSLPLPVGDYYICIKREGRLLLSEEIRILQ